MVFPIQYSSLEEAYPMWSIPENSVLPVYDDLEHLARELKPFQKLRVIDNKLQVDFRFSIYRKLTKDSRQKTLQKLKEYKRSDSLMKIIDILCTSTYKNDKKFIKECDSFMSRKSTKRL